MNSRKMVIAGNWKMNKTRVEARAFIEQLKLLVEDKNDCDVVLCVPFTDLELSLNWTQKTNIKIGAQNCHFAESGAFTGEVSAKMLKEMGVAYAIIGHSERRQFFAETDETVNLRLKAALAEGLRAIVCVGETLVQRESLTTSEVVSMQVKRALQGVRNEQMENVIIAYEPVWAIGTGKTATADEAQQVCALIRKIVAEMFGLQSAQNLIVQYGGSMNEKNCKELLSKSDIDGGLIGTASLDAEKFFMIIDSACELA